MGLISWERTGVPPYEVLRETKMLSDGSIRCQVSIKEGDREKGRVITVSKELEMTSDV